MYDECQLGCLVDIINTSKISHEANNNLVMVESDRMLDMGFEPQTNVWYPDIPKSVPKTMIFSAVFLPVIQVGTGTHLIEQKIDISNGMERSGVLKQLSLNSDSLSKTGWKLGTITHMFEKKNDLSSDKEKMGFLKQLECTTRSTARLYLRKRPVGISGVRLSLFIFAIVLFSNVGSVSGLDHGTNKTMFCPVSNTQFKRTSKNFNGWITEISEAILLEENGNECKITESPKRECTEPRVCEQYFSGAALVLSMISNFSPLVPIFGGNIDRGRRISFCRCSLALLASNLSWVCYFGPNDCKNLMGWYSLLFGCCWQGYFAWFFWQRDNNSVKSLFSLIACLVSAALAVLLHFVAKTPFMKMGPEILSGSSTISGLGGILGLIFNAISVYQRWISTSRRFDTVPFILALCGAGGPLSSMIAMKWFEDLTQLLTFKIGISILFVGRVSDVYLMLSNKHAPTPISDEITDPLLGTKNSEGITIRVSNESGGGAAENGNSTDISSDLPNQHVKKASSTSPSGNGENRKVKEVKVPPESPPGKNENVKDEKCSQCSGLLNSKPASGGENAKLDAMSTELQLPQHGVSNELPSCHEGKDRNTEVSE